jgi:hypothetical protein
MGFSLSTKRSFLMADAGAADLDTGVRMEK